MGFALQLFTNAASRFIYMFLLGMLNNSSPSYSNPHATLLANATGLTAVFSLNAFQHYIGRKTNDTVRDLQPYGAQFIVLAMALIIILTTLSLFAATSTECHWLIPTLAAAIALTLPELLYTIATAQDRPWRALVLYGGQSIFFIGYGIGVSQHETLLITTLCAATPALIVNSVLFLKLNSHTPKSSIQAGVESLGKTIRTRIGMLAASAPVIATPPALVCLLNQSSDGIPQVPQMLLFSSFVGAIVFLMGNVFQHYGRDLLAPLLKIQKHQMHARLLGLLAGMFTLSLILTAPVELILSQLKSNFAHEWTNNWYISAAVSATGTVILQWYTITCVHHGNTRPVLYANLLYLVIAACMTLASPQLGIHIFTILAVCSFIRSTWNIIDFSKTGRTAWRT